MLSTLSDLYHMTNLVCTGDFNLWNSHDYDTLELVNAVSMFGMEPMINQVTRPSNVRHRRNHATGSCIILFLLPAFIGTLVL